MKRMAAFLLILFFAIIFMVSYLPRVYNSHYGKPINMTGQTGLAVSILLFFLLPGKKRIAERNDARD